MRERSRGNLYLKLNNTRLVYTVLPLQLFCQLIGETKSEGLRSNSIYLYKAYDKMRRNFPGKGRRRGAEVRTEARKGDCSRGAQNQKIAQSATVTCISQTQIASSPQGLVPSTEATVPSAPPRYHQADIYVVYHQGAGRHSSISPHNYGVGGAAARPRLRQNFCSDAMTSCSKWRRHRLHTSDLRWPRRLNLG